MQKTFKKYIKYKIWGRKDSLKFLFIRAFHNLYWYMDAIQNPLFSTLLNKRLKIVIKTLFL